MPLGGDSDASMSIADRFKGDDGKRRLREALKEQAIVRGDEVLAEAILSVAVVEEVDAGQILIRQGGSDNDVLLIVAGRTAVLVNGRRVATRHAGQHIGEMGAIDPSALRSATVVATENTVIARIIESDFSRIADANPRMWRATAVEIARRLNERSRFHLEPNAVPVLFIGSSGETLPIAEAIAGSIPPDVAVVRLWSKGVFGASRFPMEDLAAEVAVADFAALVAGPDDHVSSRGKEFNAPRDNVVFELGLFMGALTRHRTFLIAPDGDDLKIPSDLLGLTLVRYDPSDLARIAASVSAELIANMKSKGAK